MTRLPLPSGPRSTRCRARRGAGALAGLLTAALAVTGCAGASTGSDIAAPSVTATITPSAPTPTLTPTPTPTPDPPLGVGVAPASISIPAIGLVEPLIELGIQESGEMEVPEDYFDVGWFTGGGRPGGRGPTVIAAHVDTGTGPAVFVRLPELVAGDIVEVTDVYGEVIRYTVTEVADFAKADFPTARVFGASTIDELRLITCGGWDRDEKTYLENRVVFAERTDT